MLKNIDICEDCGKLAQLTRSVCYDCFIIEQHHIESVNRFLRKNQFASAEEVMKETGVTNQKMRKLINEGRLMPEENMKFFHCSHCGTPIRKDQLCDACKSSFRKKWVEVERKEKENEKKTLTYKVHRRH